MGKVRLRFAIAAGVSAALLAGTTPGVQAVPTWTVPSPDMEQAWEAGTAGTVLDGDTLMVDITSSSSAYTGTQKVRTIGINAPEVQHDSQAEQCGAAQAETALRGLVPKGTPLQLRALYDTSYDGTRSRVVRSIYAQDTEGNWFDTARQLVSDGRALWFPHKPTLEDNPEWAHNLEYRVLADDAKADSRGLWSAGYCGSSPAASLRVSVSWDQHSSVDGYEKVFVFNDAASSISLAGWTMRDSALNLYRFPASAYVPANGSIEVRYTSGTDDPAAGIYYTGGDAWFDNLPADNPHFVGDSVYLMDNAGPYETGNMRAWFPYPCNPDECSDPLVGALNVVEPTADDWASGQEVPSAPRQVDVTSNAEGSLDVTWLAPTSVGDAVGISGYEVVATPVGGAALPAESATGLSKTLSGLTPGTDYTVAVAAENAEGWSAASAPTGPITADGAKVTVLGVPTPAPAAWTPRETIRIRNISSSALDLTGYGLWDKDARPGTDGDIDTPDYVFPRGTTIAAGETLSVRSGSPTELSPSSATLHYTGKSALFTEAGDRVELSSMNKALVDCQAWGSVTCRPARAVSISTQPVGVTARISDGNLTVNWGAPISRGGTAITGYTATAFDAANGGNPIGSCSTGGEARSCAISGLALGGSFYAEVVAQNSVGVSAPSAPRVLGVPRTVPAAPGTVTVSGGSGRVDVGWSAAAPNGATVTSYTAAAYTTATGGVPSSQCTTAGDALSCTIPGLKQGTPYFIDVSATNRVGNGAASSPRTAGTPSGAPTAVSTYSKRRVTVRWDAPAPGPSAITGYLARVYAKASGGKKLGSCTASAGATKCRTKKMKARSKYYIALTTQAGVGSFTVSPRIVTGPAKKASAPSVTNATPSGPRVVVAWSPPAFNGYTYLDKYRARLYTKYKKGRVKATCTAGASASTCTTKKMRARTYYAAVQVRNSKGWSAWSKRVKVIVK